MVAVDKRNDVFSAGREYGKWLSWDWLQARHISEAGGTMQIASSWHVSVTQPFPAGQHWGDPSTVACLYTNFADKQIANLE